LTTFLDGPAEGKTLMLRSAVVFLRVTEVKGDFDALDQPDDTPDPNETLYAYQIAAHHGNCHIRSGTKGASGFYAIASYRLCPEQPTDEIMRDNVAWRQWVFRQPIPKYERPQ